MIETAPQSDARVSVDLRLISPEDIPWYDALAKNEPRFKEDFFSGRELREQLTNRNVHAWLAWANGVLVGWCAALFPSPHHPLSSSVHLLGSIVVRDQRGKGYGSAMTRARIEHLGERPYTASVAPGNVPSEQMLTRHGFRKGLPQYPWNTWHRVSRAHLMALCADEAERSEWVKQYEGAYAETFSTIEVNGSTIARGLWPDPAAFHHISARATPAIQRELEHLRDPVRQRNGNKPSGLWP